jgi:hypothetical protein
MFTIIFKLSNLQDEIYVREMFTYLASDTDTNECISLFNRKTNIFYFFVNIKNLLFNRVRSSYATRINRWKFDRNINFNTRFSYKSNTDYEFINCQINDGAEIIFSQGIYFKKNNENDNDEIIILNEKKNQGNEFLETECIEEDNESENIINKNTETNLKNVKLDDEINQLRIELSQLRTENQNLHEKLLELLETNFKLEKELICFKFKKLK